MNLTVKRFEELTTRELYELLRLRAEIFIVEQNCVYQDLDYIDYESRHLLLTDDPPETSPSPERLIAYLRIYQAPTAGVWKLGRVVTRQHRSGYGATIFAEGIRLVRESDARATIQIESQCQAQGFYEKFGFRPISEPFVMDQLPHIKMELNLADRQHDA